MKTIQRNLDLSKKYTIIGVSYVSIIDGVGTCCDNCGRLIANIATIQDLEGVKYTVGMDCAETLSGVKGSFEFEFQHKPHFQQAKQLRSKVLKMLKEGKATGFRYYNDYLVINLKDGGTAMHQMFNPEIVKQHLKDIKQ